VKRLDRLLRRIDIVDAVDPTSLALARKDAAESERGKIPSLPFTEGDPRWLLLYDHIRIGQIDPRRMRRMCRDDLEFLAGMAQPHPVFLQSDQGMDQVTKLLGNVARANHVLARRNALRVGLAATTVGAIVATVAGAIARL
jgi:hypothetical protein